VVNDLDDGSELAGRRSVVNENDATDLDVALESGIRGHGYCSVTSTQREVSVNGSERVRGNSMPSCFPSESGLSASFEP